MIFDHGLRVAMALAVMAVVSAAGCVSGSRPGPAQPRPHRADDPAKAVRDQVWATEIAFAKTMADRDFKGFVSHLSGEVVFFDDRAIEHGADEVAAAWKPLFEAPQAPFSWAPDHVEVLSSGKLALSTGPVFVQDKVVGRYNSIWRRESGNTWRIVFDKGERVCAPTATDRGR